MYPITDPLERTVRIPVRVTKDGGLTLLNGGPMPSIKPGAVAELIVNAYELMNERQRRVYTSFVAGPFLPTGVTLLAGLKPRHGHIELDSRYSTDFLPSGWEQLAEIKLLEPLELAVRATKRASLKACRCNVPALGSEAGSLNHALTKLSERFETHRTSHTGNVFECVFYRRALEARIAPPSQSDVLTRRTHEWVPLEFLRREIEDTIELAVEQAAEGSRTPD